MTDVHSLDRFADSLDVNQAPPRARLGDLRWSELDRPLRKAMSRVLGGGSVRAIGPDNVRNLRRLGLIELEHESARLTPAGWELLRSSRAWLRSMPARSGR